MKKINLTTIRHIHFIGIKGVAMAALAVWAKERGFTVTGSDVEEAFPTDSLLAQKGIKWEIGFKKENLTNTVDLVVATGAHGGRTNIEVQLAEKKEIPVIMQGQALAIFMREKKRIAIAGSHGKTTTTALIAHLLTKNGMDPSYIVGCGNINSLGPPGHAGKGVYFVAEADEYINCPLTDKTPKFLFIKQHIAVITNIEFDHPDAYPSIDEIKHAFKQFAQQTKKTGLIVACLDSKAVRDILSHISLKKITYGEYKKADYRLVKLRFRPGSTIFSVRHKGKILGPFTLAIPGRHNAINATAASIVACQIGISWNKIARLLASFQGTKRRFELIYRDDNLQVYDDYAHHPSEIKATLRAARNWFAKSRIIAIFQPHTFSRTKVLFDDFSQAFSDANIAIIADIYPSAREQIDSSVASSQLVERMKRTHPRAYYRPNKAFVIDYLKNHAKKGDVIFTMGAGDIYTWLPEIVQVVRKLHQ